MDKRATATELLSVSCTPPPPLPTPSPVPFFRCLTPSSLPRSIPSSQPKPSRSPTSCPSSNWRRSRSSASPSRSVKYILATDNLLVCNNLHIFLCVAGHHIPSFDCPSLTHFPRQSPPSSVQTMYIGLSPPPHSQHDTNSRSKLTFPPSRFLLDQSARIVDESLMIYKLYQSLCFA